GEYDHGDRRHAAVVAVRTDRQARSPVYHPGKCARVSSQCDHRRRHGRDYARRDYGPRRGHGSDESELRRGGRHDHGRGVACADRPAPDPDAPAKTAPRPVLAPPETRGLPGPAAVAGYPAEIRPDSSGTPFMLMLERKRAATHGRTKAEPGRRGHDATP